MSVHGDDGWIQTFTGKRFWPLDPHPEDACIEDIAHALSLKCRFAGHCNRFYSVAEHCVLRAARAESLKYQLEFLLHDAAEAYLFDACRPIKKYRPQIKEDEERIARCLSLVFGIDLVDLSPECKKRDMRMLVTEQQQNMTVSHVWGSVCGVESYDFRLRYWSPHTAEKKFLEFYKAFIEELGDERQG